MPVTSRAATAAEMDSDVEWVEENLAKVESESSDQTYLVDVEQMACSCPDHVFRGTTCKHLYKAADDHDIIDL